MNKEPQESTGDQAVPAVNPTLEPPIYHKLDGFASSIEHSTPLLFLIREAQHVISYQGQKLIDAQQTLLEQECTIENLGRDVSELQKKLAIPQAFEREAFMNVLRGKAVSISREPHPFFHHIDSASKDCDCKVAGLRNEERVPCPLELDVTNSKVVFYTDENGDGRALDNRKGSLFRMPYLTIEESIDRLKRCGFRFSLNKRPRDMTIELVNFLHAHPGVKWMGLTAILSEVSNLKLALEELPGLRKQRSALGVSVENPFFDPLCEVRTSELKPEPQSDPGDEQREMEPLDVINQFAKAACNIAEVPTDEGTYKDWLCSLIDKILELQSQTKGDTGAKEEPC
jgi:hypothetical protein